MAEPKIEAPVVVETQVEETSRLKAFTVNHPRTAKVVGIVAITGATFGAISLWQNRKKVVEATEDLVEGTPLEDTSKTA